MEELWKPIIGYEDYYEISNLGNVRSIDRCVEVSGDKPQKKYNLKSKEIKQNTLFGYKICALYKNGKGHNIRVHRYVAMLFCPDYFDGCEVHHIDGNRSNNIYTNLKCISKTEHLIEHGNGLKKIYKVDNLGNKTYYDGVRLAAKENGVTHQSIVAVLKGKRKSCVGCKWYYCE